MEKKIPEFEEYLSKFTGSLDIDDRSRRDISREVRQSLLDKYDEYLIKGYGLNESVPYVLKTFEEPRKLAKMFNKIYREELIMPDISKLVYSKKLIYSSFIFIFIATAFSFLTAMQSFINILGIDFGPLGWHDVDGNIFIGTALSLTLIVLYGASLYNLLFKRLIPPKIVIWTAYINIFLVLISAAVTK